MFIGTASPVPSCFSPSVPNDTSFVEVKKNQNEQMKVVNEKRKFYYGTHQPEELEEISKTKEEHS